MKKKKARYYEFEQMLCRSRRILYKVCLTFTDRKPENIEDLYQEIVENLWRGWSKFRDESDPMSWVYRVALNTAGMELRNRKKRYRHQFIPIDEKILTTLTEEIDPLREQLYFLIDQLDADEKKLIILYLDGFSHAQIAAIAGSSEAAIKQRIMRIKLKLIKYQQDYVE